MNPRVIPGRPFPLGAEVADGGTHFAVHSPAADGVRLCLFDESGTQTQVSLPGYDAGVWHGFVPGVGPGQAYGYRVAGRFDPANGLRFNPAKLLLDPYARAVSGAVVFGPELLGHDLGNPSLPSALDSAGQVPRSLVVEATPTADRRWQSPHELADLVVYEVHVKGVTQQHPAIPEALRGTYAGLAHPVMVTYLTDLGVTAVELLPVHHSVPEAFLVDRGLTNYWGYNTIGFFAPHAGYSAAVRAGRPYGQVSEFRSMVDALHEAGIEVWLDVVYNHTAEAGADGPTLSLRGLDNAGYYRLSPADRAQYFDTTGTGNSINAGDPASLRLIMDSLRYWAGPMGVDGFRFDLAATLARQEGGFDEMSAFFDLVAQDPVIRTSRLIAEPWDVGQADSYDVGRFPAQWSEWNGRFRDSVRDFWRSHDGLLPDMGRRLTGSPDLYRGARRGPQASVNLVTVHDGFTLRDLVSFDAKHNEANGEGNRDGTSDNRSWNCGVEGPTSDPDVLALRAGRSRAMLATLLLAHGVPLLLGGDELGRSQGGNNNAYCQDNEVSWWTWEDTDPVMLAFTQRLLRLRRTHPVFRRRRFPEHPDALRWYDVSGSALTEQGWQDPSARSLALVLDGSVDPDEDEAGELLVGDDIALLVNAWWQPLEFAATWVPDATWDIEADTADVDRTGSVLPADRVRVAPRSMLVLRRR